MMNQSDFDAGENRSHGAAANDFIAKDVAGPSAVGAASVGRKSARRRTRFGPGLFVMAAFIGPGTVVTASRAGAGAGCGLLWAVVFACFATIVLQSFAARLGITTGRGLGESLRDRLRATAWFYPAALLVVLAIGVGNAAYQTGNLTGAARGMISIFGGSQSLWVGALALSTAIVLWFGRYRSLQYLLILLVALLSVSFVATSLLTLPPMDRIVQGLTRPEVAGADLTLVIALIGTTIVPYNLFLHASGAAKAWRSDQECEGDQGGDQWMPSDSTAYRDSWWDTVLSVSLGGLITAAILLTADSAFFQHGIPWTGMDQISMQLEPALGRGSGVAFAIGLFAAGLTSCITAPMATAFAVCGTLGWDSSPGTTPFRTVSLSVVAVGALAAMTTGSSPASVILLAQVANGLLLPIVASYLLFVVYKQGGRSFGSRLTYALGWLVVVAVGFLGAWRIYLAFA